jgi:threonine dehydratase
MITQQEIQVARKIIFGKLHRTPLVTSRTLSETLSLDVRLKAELLQKTGSFKPRGVLNKIAQLSASEKQRGLIAVSAGNHAQAVAYVARLEGLKVTVVMPENAVAAKVQATRSFGAEVVLHGKMTDLFPKAQEIQRERGLTMIHPFDDGAVIAGQATVGMEILDDAPDIEAAIVPIGGGGLIAGIATAIKLQKPSVKIIGVEPEGAASMYRSLREQKAVRLDKVETIADGLAAPYAGEIAYQHIKNYLDEIVLVRDEEILQAIWFVLERCKFLTEPAGATSVAALLSGKIKLPSGTKTVCVLSGGNIGLNRIWELWQKQT